MLNFVTRLGWAFDDKQEIFSVEELIEKFDLARVGKSGSVFDIKKLDWLNTHYIGKLDVAARTEAVIPFWEKEGIDVVAEPRERLESIVTAVGERLTKLQDIVPQTRYFFAAPTEYEPKAVKKWWKKDARDILIALGAVLEAVEPFETGDSRIGDVAIHGGTQHQTRCGDADIANRADWHIVRAKSV